MALKRIGRTAQTLSGSSSPDALLPSLLSSFSMGSQIRQHMTGASTVGIDVDIGSSHSSKSSSSSPSERLGAIALSELQKEIYRDEGEGLKSVAPQVPPGWSVTHEPRSRWMVMRRLSSFNSSGGRGGRGRGGHNEEPPSHTSLSAMQYKGQLNKGRPMTAATSGSGQGGSGGGGGKRNPLISKFWSMSVPSSMASPMDVEIYIPFATHDPSLYDNTIDVCEWQPFDVICSKASVAPPSSPDASANGSHHHQHRHDTALLFRLAAVNSQVRVRGIQALTPSAAREIGSTDGGIGIFAGYGPSADYTRKLAYHGPSFPSLSPPLKACLMDFIAHDIGIDDLLLEYIMQACYVSENEEYQKWLLDLNTFAKGL